MSRRSKDDPQIEAAITAHQAAAAAAPDRPTSDLVGNFGDFDSLFEQLSHPVVIELGNPLPKEKFMPHSRVGSCPASHNRALLDD